MSSEQKIIKVLLSKWEKVLKTLNKGLVSALQQCAGSIMPMTSSRKGIMSFQLGISVTKKTTMRTDIQTNNVAYLQLWSIMAHPLY